MNTTLVLESPGPKDSVMVHCQELVGYVYEILDFQCPQQVRTAHIQKIEHFKEENPYCMQCGFLLMAEQDPVVKHFGLQLIEHCVKFRWQRLQPLEQVDFQLKMLEFMTNNAYVTQHEPLYIKEGLARVIVETAKMSWPQKWASFLNDMDTLAKAGVTQLELVLRIFRRFSEDVYTYESDLTPKRKKEMTTALNEHTKDIFVFLLSNLEAPPTSDLRSVALSAITSFAEWTDFTILLMENCKLLVLLYTMIGVEDFKTAACECLLVIVARKGDIRRTAEERLKLLNLLSKDALDGILKASIDASSQGVVEEQYVFLKRICQVLVHLGVSQLGALWTHQPGFKKPDTFEQYLNLVVEFTRHPSQLLSLTSFEVWSSFINHNHIKEEKSFKDFLPLLLTVMRTKFSKFGDPSHTGNVSSEYSQLDFDGLEEYTLFFSQYRSKLYKVIHQLCQMNPRTASNEALVALQELVQKKSTEECTRISPLYIEWDGYVGFLECWAHSLKTDPALREIQIVKENCLSVLMSLLEYETRDALLLQCQFKCLQSPGLLLFLGCNQAHFQLYIQKVFSSIGYTGNSIDKNNLPKEVVNVRNLTITCFVHLCETQRDLMAPFLEEINGHYKSLIEKDILVNAEKCSFMESLIMLSLKKHSISEQTQFIGELLHEVNIGAQQIIKCVESAENAIESFGLNKNPADLSHPGLVWSKLLCFVVRSVLLILKRMVPLSEMNDKLDRPECHPAYSHVIPVLIKCCVPYLKSFYEVWSCSRRQLLGEQFNTISQLHPHERDAALGKTTFRRTEQVEYGVVGTIQMRLITAHDESLQVIMRACSVFGIAHLHSLDVLTAVQQAMLSNVASLHHWRLRNILRFLMIPIVSLCAEDLSCDALLVSYLLPLCQHIFVILKENWNMVAERRKVTTDVIECSEQSRCTESEELLQEQLTVFLSREYSTLLELICVKKVTTGQKGKHTEDSEDIAMMEDIDEDTSKVLQSSENSHELTSWSLFQSLAPLGERMLQQKEMCELLLLSSFCGMAWNDSQSSIKCINVAGVVYTKIPMEHFSPDVHECLFTQVLRAMQINGTSDHIRNPLSFLAMLIYQSTVPNGYCPNIQNLLLQVPGTSLNAVKAFDRLLVKDPPATIRVKKEKFRDLVSGVIGKYVGEEFKRPLIFDLPEMEFKRKAKHSGSETVANLSALFKADT